MASRRNLLYCALALVVCALLAVADHKGKPHGKPGGGGGGGGGDPTGVIYFTLSGELHTMNADGSNKTALPTDVSGEPSRTLHGDHRWFLQVRDTADGRQLFAVRDDGDEGFAVQLTTDTTLVVVPLMSARWGVDDTEVSWVAQRTDIVEGGIYAADIVFDALGNVTGLAAQPVGPLVEGSIITVNSELRPDIRSHDWSPDGNAIVYDTVQPNGTIAHQITIADVVAGTSTVHPTANQAAGPVWSPDGSKIAYGGKPIATINPDGSGEKTILRGFLGPNWSPTGDHMIFSKPASVLDGERQDVYRSNAKGGSRANLTSELDTRWGSGTPASPVAWR